MYFIKELCVNLVTYQKLKLHMALNYIFSSIVFVGYIVLSIIYKAWHSFTHAFGWFTFYKRV